jgi:hypothetical protein
MKTITIRVALKSSRARVTEEGGVIKVHVTRLPEDGKANEQVVELLADYFKVKKYQVAIVQGLTSRTKTVQILD